MAIMRTLFLFAIPLLTACSSASYKKTFSDGSVLEASAFEFGTDKTIQGFEYEANGVKMKMESLDKNQTDGLAAIAEGVAKGVAKGIKP